MEITCLCIYDNSIWTFRSNDHSPILIVFCIICFIEKHSLDDLVNCYKSKNIKHKDQYV